MKAIWAGINAVAALLTLSGCAGNPKSPQMSGASHANETIRIAVGPCFGFCPVYEAQIAPNGTVIFQGERHTAVLGERRREAGATLYQALAGELARFRPANGRTQRVACESAITDTSIYTLTWQSAEGEETVATHPQGCNGGPGQTLDNIIRTLPDRLGISDWAKQVTRPGASRG